MEQGRSRLPRRSVDLSADPNQRSALSDAAVSNATAVGATSTSTTNPNSDHPAATPGASSAPDSATSYTMIYPIRSLLAEVQPSDAPSQPNQQQQSPQFPPVLPTPSLATASIADPMNLRFQQDPTPVTSLHRTGSIQQRRTAQWQANISDRRSSGRISLPPSPEIRTSALSSPPLMSPTSSGPNPLLGPSVSSGNPTTATVAATTGTRPRQTRQRSASVVGKGKTSAANLENEATQPEHQLTKSNVALKAARETAADSATAIAPNTAANNTVGDTVSTIDARAGAVETLKAADADADADANPISDPSSSTPQAARPGLNTNPLSQPSAVTSLPPPQDAAPLNALAPFRSQSEGATSNTPAASERASSFAAGGYVHLGPVRTSDVDEFVNDQASRSSGSKHHGSGGGGKIKPRRRKAGVSASLVGSGSGIGGPSDSASGSAQSKGLKKPRPLSNATGKQSASSVDSIPPAAFPLHIPQTRRPLSGGVGIENSSPGAADRTNDESPYPSFESSVSASAAGEDSILSRSISEVEEVEQAEREQFNRSVENLAVPGEGMALDEADSLDDDDLRDLDDDEVDADDEERERASMGNASGNSGSSGSVFGYPKTARFQHVETENGHHILLGREGVLERCEDEPIHTPGAVQGFGVLIALEEDLDGNLVVRVVSENCSEILGLTPSYLFNLECFTHTLPQMQADNLWDNIQYLSDPSMLDSGTDGSADEAPQVFLLSGYGQPGSATVPGMTSSGGEDGSERGGGSTSSHSSSRPFSSLSSSSSTERRQWSCWCAAHRPKMLPRPPPPSTASPPSSGAGSGESNVTPNPNAITPEESLAPNSLIILELELEHDMYNPLYPPPPEFLTPSGGESPNGVRSSASVASGGSGSGGTGSGTTPMPGTNGGRTSEGSDRTIMAASITPPASKSGAPSSTMSPGSASRSGANSADDPRPILERVDEDGRPDMMNSHLAGESSSVTPRQQGQPGDEQLHIGGPGDSGEDKSTWGPTTEQILASTTSKAQPIRALERMRQAERTATQRRLASLRRGGAAGGSHRGGSRHQHRSSRLAYGGSGSLDVFSVLGQVNEQLSGASDLQSFLDVVVGIMKDLTQFHRVLIYQFDEIANGQVVAELVDYTKTKDLYRGLHFPAADIPPQAREMYKTNKVRSLYDRDQTTARLVGRTKADVEAPLDLTHSYLRAMSPIHLKYLGNMGVRSSMSISIVSFGQLWGLVCCHSYGEYGMRVSFPVRQMLRLLSDSISRNIERLSYAHRLHTRKLINTIPTEAHPTGHIVSNAEDLLGLFDADFGILVIGEGAKILGPNENGQDIRIIAEYLRVKQFKIMQATQDITKDFPDIGLHAGPNVIAGVLYVPLSAGGKDFIAFLRKGQLREVTWAGRATKGEDGQASLEPRSSFKAWSEVISSRSRAWTDEQLETAGVLALVYGKFIDVWRQKESAIKATQLTNLLLSNASHEVRTPLNHIINYLELAMNGPLDHETRENLSMSHAASKNLLFTINDLLDLTRLESGNETSLSEPFDLPFAIEDAVQVYRTEAERRNIKFTVVTENLPKMVVGDGRKIRTAVANLTANAVKFTDQGEIRVEAHQFLEPQGLRDPSQIVVEVTVADTGCGIEGTKLESIFRELEQVEHASKSEKETGNAGLGLGLAVVAHIVGQLGGQLRVDSKPGVGSQFVFLIPFTLPKTKSIQSSQSSSRALSFSSNSGKAGSAGTRSSRGQEEIDSLVEALGSSPQPAPSISPAGRWGSQPDLATDPRTDPTTAKAAARSTMLSDKRPVSEGEVELNDSNFPLRSVRVDPVDVEVAGSGSSVSKKGPPAGFPKIAGPSAPSDSTRLSRKTITQPSFASEKPSFNVLIVEDDAVNRNILTKRLKMDGHQISTSVNGQEAVDLIKKDRSFDCILMDIQMPILDGFGAAEQIRKIEKANPLPLDALRPSADLNNGIPIFAVSASLKESQRQFMLEKGMDAWILKPIDFKRLNVLMRGATDVEQRKQDLYRPGADWERGGWMHEAIGTMPASPPNASRTDATGSANG